MSVFSIAAVALLAATASAVPTSSSQSSSDNIDRCLKNTDLFGSTDEGYNKSQSSYWSKQARTDPRCIVQPSSAGRVADVVKTLVDNKCLFAIRSGGHNPFPDNNINSTGVTIDLTELKTVSYSNDTGTGPVASIGPGARWGQVYDYLSPKNVSVPGGRAATVGVGGLTLGGGNSFFAARFGLVCDNVVNFQVVLANSTIVNANKTSNAGLWKALKGGSNNFGIVTRIDLTAFASGDIWGGIALYPSTTIPTQISALVNFTEKIDQDPYGSLITFWAYSSATNTTVVENAYEYTKPVSNPAPFNELLAIQPSILNTTRIGNLTSLTTELEATGNLRDLFATLTFANNASLISQVYNFSETLRQPLADVPGLNWIVMFQPLPSVISKHSVERGGNVLGLDRAKGNQILFLFFVQWNNTADDARLQTAASSLIKNVTDYAKAQNQSNEWIYLNYALADQDVLGSYGKANVDFINKTATAYDPNGVFQKYVPGGYKLSSARPAA